jgi:hypothetical protein
MRELMAFYPDKCSVLSVTKNGSNQYNTITSSITIYLNL